MGFKNFMDRFEKVIKCLLAHWKGHMLVSTNIFPVTATQHYPVNFQYILLGTKYKWVSGFNQISDISSIKIWYLLLK